MKDVEFVVTLEDIDDLNFTSEERREINERIKYCLSFGTNFSDVVLVYPTVIAQELKKENAIIAKFTYTVVHELIHALLHDVNFNNEDNAHGLTMMITDDIVSNKSNNGGIFYRQFNEKCEIVVNDTEDEEPQFEAEKLNAARNLSRIRLAKHHELTGL